jgi:micrococcal nuclease
MRRAAGSLILLALVAIVVFADLGSESGAPRVDGTGAELSGRSVRADVERIVDGDTIEVRIGGRSDDVRYIGIDTPETVKPGEPVQCFGPQSSSANKRLVQGRTVRLVFDRERRDVYGRLLAYAYAEGRFVNAALVRGGYARTLTIAPNTAHAGLFRRLAQAAGRAGRGLWGAC